MKRVRLIWVLSVLQWLAISYATASTEVVDLAQVRNGEAINAVVEYWPDSQGVSAEEALERGDFNALPERATTFNAKKHWYRLRLQNTNANNREYFLATGLPSTPKIATYWITGEQLKPDFLLLDRDSFYHRPLQYPLLFVPIVVPPNTQQQLLIEHQSLANYPLAMRFFDGVALQHKMATFTLARGFVFGALFVFLALFLMQTVAAPSKALIFYCCYIATLLLLVGQVFGYNFAYLWPEDGHFNSEFTPFISGVTYAFYFLFSATLFKLKAAKPKLYGVTVGLAVLTFLLAVVNFYMGVFWLLAALALVGLPVPVLIGLWACRQGLTSANLFLAGSAVHCSLSYLLALECLGVHLGYSYYLFSFLSVGQIVDLGLFSAALLRQASELRKAFHEQLQQRLHDAETLALTEQERAKALMAKQQDALNLAAATHDLNQPLAAIRFALALVDGGKATAAKDHIAQTLNYTQELLRSMTESGQREYQNAQQLIRVEPMLVRLQAQHDDAFKTKGLRMRCRANVPAFSGLPVVVQRIADNLLVNACRYTQQGGALFALRKHSGGVLIQVWDSGVGMSDAQVATLQQPFSQADKHALQGFGLGLFIVKTLAEKAGYPLNIRTRLGGGTCVSVLIPQI